MTGDARADGPDEGFGLVEVVVAMMLFMLLALSFVPILSRGLELSARNTAAVTATQAATSTLEEGRLQGAGGCEAFVTWLGRHPLTPEFGATDGIGRQMTVSVGVASGLPVCDAAVYTDTTVDVVVVVSSRNAPSDPVNVGTGGDVHAKVSATIRIAGKVDL